MPRGGARFFRYPKEEFPVEVQAFKNLQQRVTLGRVPGTAWPRSLEGFYAFLACVGRVPKKMKRPTIGRRDHSKGYEPGNCDWQEWDDNVSDAIKRQADNVRGKPRPPFSDEWKRNIGLATSKRRHTEETKRKIGLSVSGSKNGFYGRRHSAETKRKISEARRAR